MTESYQGPERRSPESMLARELVECRREAKRLKYELDRTARWDRRRRKLKQTFERSDERQGQILATLGAKRSNGST